MFLQQHKAKPIFLQCLSYSGGLSGTKANMHYLKMLRPPNSPSSQLRKYWRLKLV